MELAEDVADARTGNRLDGAAALPHAERHLQVLAAPAVHLLVVAAHLPEVQAVHREEAARHRRTVRRTDLHVAWVLALRLLPPALPLRYVDPVKVAVPGEAADLERVVAVGRVVEVLRVDHVDDGHDHTGPGLLDAVQHRLQPRPHALAVRVQEDQHVLLGGPRTRQTGSDQTGAGERGREINNSFTI